MSETLISWVRCCWCDQCLTRESETHPWLCRTPACFDRIRPWVMTTQKTRKGKPTGEIGDWLFAPTPKQAAFLEQTRRTKYTAFGGSAGGSKSHVLRWGLYYHAATIPGLRCLLLRRTFPELENTHLMRMPREAVRLAPLGARYLSGDREFHLTGNDSLIKAGHCETAQDVAKWLSTEWDLVAFDEVVTFDRDAALEIMTRARTANEAVKRTLGGAQVWAGTNPGGRGALWVKEFWIDHAPDPERYPSYDGSQWGFIEAKLDDNPYLERDYRLTLMNLPPVRRRQLLDGDWDAFEGQAFDFQANKDGQPWHVRDLGIAA